MSLSKMTANVRGSTANIGNEQIIATFLQKNEAEEGANQWKAKCDALESEKRDISQLLTMTKATSEMLEAERSRQMNEIENMKKVPLS